MTHPIVIAVDGTAASGKGTIAKMLARHFGFAHMDSGALYRLAALAAVEEGGDPAKESDALKAAHVIDLSRAGDRKIRTAEIGTAASKLSAFPSVRAALLAFQREFLAEPPGDSPGAVMDGRDIGTVIAPNADAKLFVDADVNVRAHRRWLELESMDLGVVDEAQVLADLKARDQADRTRAASPLKPAPDAALLDTTHLAIDAAFQAALALVEPRLRGKLKASP
jgi:cytidylate kinase